MKSFVRLHMKLHRCRICDVEFYAYHCPHCGVQAEVVPGEHSKR